MSKYSTHPQFLEFERLFGSSAVDDLLQRIVETQANYGDRGGDGISLSVTETSLNRYDVSGYLDYAGQEMTFELNWGAGHGTEVTDFDFDVDEVLSIRQQVLTGATQDQVLGSLLEAVLDHVQPAFCDEGLPWAPTRVPVRLNRVFDTNRAALCLPARLLDPALNTSYPVVAQCELVFQGEACRLSVGLGALHVDDYDDELAHWASAFASKTLVSQEFKLDDNGLLEVEPAARKLYDAWAALRQASAVDGFSPLAALEHQFAGSVLAACAP